MKWENIDEILKNEQMYRNIIYNHYNESNVFDDLNVQNNTFGNTNEKSVINKIENKDYKEALLVVNTIDDFLENATELEKMIYKYKFRENLYLEQICWKVHYRKTKVKEKIREIRRFFEERL